MHAEQHIINIVSQQRLFYSSDLPHTIYQCTEHYQEYTLGITGEATQI